MKFVVVTGMSGGGKSTAMKMLEDAGFYCVDNLPVSLISTFAELIAPSGSEIEKAALGLDVRSKGSFAQTEGVSMPLTTGALAALRHIVWGPRRRLRRGEAHPGHRVRGLHPGQPLRCEARSGSI